MRYDYSVSFFVVSSSYKYYSVQWNTTMLPTRIVNKDGSVQYVLDDVLHRDDGPAIKRADGSTEWWVNGERKLGTEVNVFILGRMQASDPKAKISYKETITSLFENYKVR